jgi:hypothetical protein
VEKKYLFSSSNFLFCFIITYFYTAALFAYIILMPVLLQEDAAKRHAENLENIRHKAFELSVQKCGTDEGVPLIKPYMTNKKVS